MITRSGDGDTFWDIVRSGEQTAVTDNVNFLSSVAALRCPARHPT